MQGFLLAKKHCSIKFLWCDFGGRLWAVQLERLREYHRESENLGKRYVEVIRAFNPNYTPYMEEDVAQMSRSIPCLAIT